MKFLSVCSGIEAASVAWEPLGWEAVAFSEIEKFPSAVLAHHWPDVPNLGDMTQYNEWKLNQPIDLLVGGTPCQSFSVAGLRKGLQDPRGNLTLTFLAMAEKFKPRWVVWENVPGVLSDKTNAFGQFLAGLGELGYGFAYRVLDAQHFGVPQRRRRVFVVGCLGDWQRAAKVLFEPEGLCGDLTPSREAREEVAGFTASSFGGFREGCGTVRANGGDLGGGSETLIPEQVCGPLTAGMGKGPRGTEAVEGNHLIPEIANCIQTTCHDYSRADGFNMIPQPIQNATRGKSQNGIGIGKPGDAMYTLDQASQHAVAFGVSEKPEVAHCLRSGASMADKHESTTYIQSSMQVRRLTPTECERLQGFNDCHTLIPWRNKPAEECPDGPRYKALGNSMAVPVMAWIGQRIAKQLHNV
jgi:DNA (cytosine-5)-methyltransferase 1